jgi:hypothetical protein
MDQLKPSTTIYGDMSARALVEIVEELREKVADLEQELKECRAVADDASGTASDVDYRLRELVDDLENGEIPV